MSSIIARQQVEEAVQSPVTLNLRDLEQVARQEIEQAKAKAREILTEALAKAREAEQVAAARGEKAGYDAGLARGRQEGRDQALKEESERLSEDTASVREALIEVLKEIQIQRNDLLAEARQDLLLLAVAIAERICRLQFSINSDHVQPLLEEVIEQAGSGSGLVLRVHPADAAAAEQFLSRLHADLVGHDSSPITLAADRKVSRGGCVAERTSGRVDAQVETQIARVARELIGVDCPVAVTCGGNA
ncbi:MAG: hypothetical protein GWP05_01185 [Anaerolineaceae bacterium]|nr:hypothetical protein [Anaerolineaceae bacterium]